MISWDHVTTAQMRAMQENTGASDTDWQYPSAMRRIAHAWYAQAMLGSDDYADAVTKSGIALSRYTDLCRIFYGG